MRTLEAAVTWACVIALYGLGIAIVGAWWSAW